MKFRELTTDDEVDIAGLPTWDGEPALAMVTYADGSQKALRWTTVFNYFEQLAGQSVALDGRNEDAQRPTKAQEHLAAFINALRGK